MPHKLLWLDHDGSAQVLWADDRLVGARFDREGIDPGSGHVWGPFAITSDKGGVPWPVFSDAKLFAYDACSWIWGLRVRHDLVSPAREWRGWLGSQRVLLFDAPPWHGRREGFYCMGCGHPPR